MAFDLQIGAATVYMEASGEPDDGERGVAHVLVNRAKDPKKRWGTTLAEVCLEASQFSSWNTRDDNRIRLGAAADDDPVLQKIIGFMQGAIDGTDPDPTGGAIYYFNPDLAKPDWAESLIKTVTLGHQEFFKDP
jgi:N-acetylmuramoyl-L-alanine amidase